ncbi:hypothetical protein K438DRAFT_1938879 [Mycena galopus ATCC 62051]|nr:hypothetical protein K438DRAFT_1938879 [Mycena galopus ATCC 62051]
MPSTHLKCLGQALKMVIPFTRSSAGPSCTKSLPFEAEPNALHADYSPSPSSSPSSTRGIWESDNETAVLDNIPFFFVYGYSNSANALPAPAEPAAATPMLEHLAHQPIPILYSSYIPTIYESLKDEVADCMNKFREFKRVIDTTVALWATNSCGEEDRVYNLREPASCVFELGDVVRCHGLVTSDWRMTGPVERYSRWSKKQWHGQQDWVCIVCQNPLLQQEVLGKIPAK